MNSNFYKSNRSYLNIKNNMMYDMYVENYTKKLVLLNEQSNDSISSFACAAHTSLEYKFADKSIVKLNHGEFIPLEGKVITHVKYCGFEKFTKY